MRPYFFSGRYQDVDPLFETKSFWIDNAMTDGPFVLARMMICHRVSRHDSADRRHSKGAARWRVWGRRYGARRCDFGRWSWLTVMNDFARPLIIAHSGPERAPFIKMSQSAPPPPTGRFRRPGMAAETFTRRAAIRPAGRERACMSEEAQRNSSKAPIRRIVFLFRVPVQATGGQYNAATQMFL